jgi:hypothetical protein
MNGVALSKFKVTFKDDGTETIEATENRVEGDWVVFADDRNKIISRIRAAAIRRVDVDETQ